MTTHDPDTRLHELHLAAERISNNLVELEIDPGRQLLEASRLEGRSGEKWSAASAALTELWRRRGLLEALLERADSVHDTNQVRSLLDGASIELSDGVVPLAERHLLSSVRVAERCSPEELLSWMSAAFDEVKEAMTELTGAWDALSPRLDAARRLLEHATQLAEELGEPGADELEPAAASLQRLTSKLTTDPLSVTPHQVDEMERELGTLRDGVDEAAALRGAGEGRLKDARERLVRLQMLVGEVQATHEELALKVLLPSVPEVPAVPAGLEAQLDQIAELMRKRSWREASGALDRWTERVDMLMRAACQAHDANRAPIEARNQFRGLLEAYRVKAQRLGVLEDPELEALFGQALEVLYTAPTDLALAARLVRSCQIALSGADARGKATP